MITKQEIFQKIIDNKETIKSFGVTEIGLFGSYVRDEQTEESDIDILVDYNLEQIMVAVSGKITIYTEMPDGITSEFILNSPNKGLFLPK